MRNKFTLGHWISAILLMLIVVLSALIWGSREQPVPNLNSTFTPVPEQQPSNQGLAPSPGDSLPTEGVPTAPPKTGPAQPVA